MENISYELGSELRNELFYSLWDNIGYYRTDKLTQNINQLMVTIWKII